MPSPTIRPARGLWAAVRPNGEISLASIFRAKRDARDYATSGFGDDWPEFAARGWRIIRVDVIPHEESDNGK